MTLGRVAVLGAVAVSGCELAEPAFPPAVEVAKAPEAARGLRVHVYGDGLTRPFDDAVARALKEAGITVVSGEPFDLAIHGRCYPRGQPVGTDRDVCWLRGESEDFDLGSRTDHVVRSSWLARYRAADTLYVWAPDPSRPPLERCVEAWKSEARRRPAGEERLGAPALAEGIAVFGPRSARTTREERAAQYSATASVLVNRLLQCPGFTEAAEIIAKSGLGAAGRMEDLPAEKLLNLCEHAVEPQLTDSAVPTGGAAQLLRGVRARREEGSSARR